MNLLVLFIITNIIFSIYLECRKFKFATITHAVTFIVLLAFLLMGLGNIYPEIDAFFCRIIGKTAYSAIVAVICGTNALQAIILTPLIAIEASIILTALISVIIVVNKIVDFVNKCKKRLYERVSVKKKICARANGALCFARHVKIYRKNCIMLC